MEKTIERYPDFGEKLKEERNYKRIKIGVVPACNGAGASYICGQFIKNGLPDGVLDDAQNAHISLTELGNCYFYEALDMEKRFARIGFRFYTDLLMCHMKLSDYCNETEGVYWYLRGRWETEALSAADMMRVIYTVKGDICIFDFSGVTHEATLEVLPEMDLIYLVIDPLPAKLLQNAEYINRVRDFASCEIIVNKFNDGIHKGELNKFLGTKNYISYPARDLKEIYSAEYNCVLP